jgi:dicarboxylate transporter DctA-like protein
MGRASPAKRRRRRRGLYAALLAVLLVVATIAVVTALRGRELAGEVVRAALSRAGVATQALEVRSVGLGGITFGAMHLGDAEGPSASSVTVDWTLRSLWHGGLGRVRVDGLQLTMRFGQAGLTIAGWPANSAPGSTPGGAALPFDRLDLSGAHLSFGATAKGYPTATLSLEATIAPGAGGVVSGHATIDGVVTAAGEAPTRITADLPDWHLVNDGSRLQIAASHTTLTLPQRHIALSDLSVSALLAGDAESFSLSGALRDGTAPPAWPPLALTVEGRREKSAFVVVGHGETADHAVVLALDGRHDLASGRGSLVVNAAPVMFKSDGRQPADLFPAAGRALSRVDGSLAAIATLSWGGRNLATTLVVLLNGIGFEGGLAGMSNLDGKVTFVSLVPLRTAEAQHVTANLRIASLPPGPLDLRFGLPSRDRLLVDRATLGLAGGTLSLTGFAFARGEPLDTVLDVSAVDLGSVLTLIGIDGLSGSGALDGTIPLRVDPAGVTIAGGRLAATGPGVVRYTGAGLPDAITGAQGKAGEALTLTREALADFHYSGLTLALDRSPSGDGSLLVGLKGNNPAVLDGHPFDINIRLDANFDRLATIFLSGYAAAEGLLRGAAGR